MYDLFFQPIVIIFQYLYLSIVALTKNLGCSLVFLSIAVNIILRPFSAWASRIQNKERKIQEILTPQINDIKHEYSGADQHAELSELYRRYAYNPLYAIRSGTDLFIQLLPLSAAYVMLSSLNILKGQSFLGISDLSQPDALINGINLLPILMTVVNFLATLTTERFTRKEKIQAFIIAILFLIMLYNAPSALLVYWTSNNVIMLLKNVFIAVLKNKIWQKISQISLYKISLANWLAGFFIFFVPCVVWGCYVVYFSSLFMALWPPTLEQTHLCLMSTSILFVFFFVWMCFSRFIENEFSISELLIKTSYVLFGILILLLIMRYMFIHAEGIRGPFKTRYVFFFLLAQTFYFICAIPLSMPNVKIKKIMNSIVSSKQNTHLFFASFVFLLILFCVFFPAMLYHSDPEFFPSSFSASILAVCKYGMITLFIAICLWPMLSIIFKSFLAILIAIIACSSFLNFFVLAEYYGELNALQLNVSSLKVGIQSISKDALSIFVSVICVILCAYYRKFKYLINAFFLLSISMFIAFIYYGFTMTDKLSDSIAYSKNFPNYHERLWRFSKSKKNVVGIFLDGFTGDHLLRILDESPELAKKLEGFIYFPDTVSVGAWTNLSVGAIYGGPIYKPHMLNKLWPNKPLPEKFADAFSLYPNSFSEKKYDVVIAGTPMLYDDNKYISSKIKNPDSTLFIRGFSWGKDYVPHWLHWANNQGFSLVDEEQQDSIALFSLYLALFRASPFSLRAYLYNGGNWHLGIAEKILNVTLRNNFLPDISVLQFMGDFATADNGSSAFKMIYSSLSHPPCYLPESSLFPVADPYPETKGQSIHINDVYPEHYYTEKHIMNFLADFVLSLKRLGVYDNTRIVIVSDHDFSDSWKLRESRNKFVGSTLEGYVWPNALLMFKDFGIRHPLRISDALMSNEDVPSLLMDGIVNLEGIPTLDEIRMISNTERIRTHAGQTIHFWDKNANLFNLDAGVFEIRGTMFKKENWTKIQ